MRLGISGHRAREGADWAWVRERMAEIVGEFRNPIGFSSLAGGADQIFANAILARGGKLVAVLPVHEDMPAYTGAEAEEFLRLTALSKRRLRIAGRTPGEAHLNAGKRIVDKVELMIFVWDGEPSQGPGGTAEIVAYARRRRRRRLILDPIARTVRREQH